MLEPSHGKKKKKTQSTGQQPTWPDWHSTPHFNAILFPTAIAVQRETVASQCYTVSTQTNCRTKCRCELALAAWAIVRQEVTVKSNHLFNHICNSLNKLPTPMLQLSGSSRFEFEKKSFYLHACALNKGCMHQCTLICKYACMCACVFVGLKRKDGWGFGRARASHYNIASASGIWVERSESIRAWESSCALAHEQLHLKKWLRQAHRLRNWHLSAPPLPMPSCPCPQRPHCTTNQIEWFKTKQQRKKKMNQVPSVSPESAYVCSLHHIPQHIQVSGDD